MATLYSREYRDQYELLDGYHIKYPRSVAIIMDGNGRWAQARQLPRCAGHIRGAQAVTRIVTESSQLGLEALTLYSFSTENWSRPDDEIKSLMKLYADYLVRERSRLMKNNIRLRHLGQRDGLPSRLLDELDRSIQLSAKNTGMTLCLALNYSGRAEIKKAIIQLVEKTKKGELDADAIDESVISSALDTDGIPDPDLVIRTAGELRLSNFLLWQVAYSELYVTDVYWPEFNEADLHKALHAYSLRQRRFGGLPKSKSA